MNFDELDQGLYSTKHGNFWLPDHNHNDPLIDNIKEGTLFDNHVIEACKKFITPGSTVIDVGANFGQMSLQWSKMVGPEGHVHAFECSEFVSYFLKKTMKQNDHASNVTVHTEAVWHTAGENLEMLLPDGTPKGQFYSGMGIKGPEKTEYRKMNSHPVVSTTIDSFEYESPVSVIKVDAQGSDFYVLKGAENTIRKHKPLLAFEYEPEYDDIFSVYFGLLDAWLRGLGYVVNPDIEGNGHDFFYIYKEPIA